MLFITQYCQRYGCPRREFARHLVRHCLSRRAILLRFLIEKLSPHYFEHELELAEALGRQSDMAGVQLEIDLYHAKSVEQSFCRRWLGLRLRCRKLKKMAYNFLCCQEEMVEEPPPKTEKGAKRVIELEPPVQA